MLRSITSARQFSPYLLDEIRSQLAALFRAGSVMTALPDIVIVPVENEETLSSDSFFHLPTFTLLFSTGITLHIGAIVLFPCNER
jgi:hypothetical protein